MWPQRRADASVNVEEPPQASVRAQGRIRRLWRGPAWALAALFVMLALADALLYQVTLPVTITSDGATLTIAVDGAATQRLPIHGRILSVAIPARDPVIHEYQLDGTDSANNFTLDPVYLQSISGSAYYHLYAWMRDLDGLSRWRDLCVSAADATHPASCVAYPPLSGAQLLASTGGAAQRITARLQRPETPVSLSLTMSDTSVVGLVIDRNDHAVIITRTLPGQPSIRVVQTFFPTAPAPFAAMTADFLVRLAMWALALLAVICGGEWLVGWALGMLRLSGPTQTATARDDEPAPDRAAPGHVARSRALVHRLWDALAAGWRGLTDAIHPIGLAALAVSFLFVVWIALAQYHALPHIYDASAYLFGAKTFAEGRLFAPAPAAADRFPGPFMIMRGGKWFTQYEPGDPLTLALGVALGVPWLVEPLLGTLALLGVGLIARRLYDRRVATLAVLLGVVSPFYSYLAASYLSHTITLFYLVWGCVALLRCLQGGSRWLLPLAGLLWVMAALTRDTSVIFAAVAAGGALWLARRDRWRALPTGRLRDLDWLRWVAPTMALVCVGLFGLLVYLSYNAALTGGALTTPRQLFFPGDHYGFGPGVGFYGEHTLAAGFITVDELLTSLAIDLYGWPFYLTLAFLLVPFLTRRARAADVVMLLGAGLMTFAFIGFYYHGIYLGPRYLFEALPFFLILTARGLLTLADSGLASRSLGMAWARERAGGASRQAASGAKSARSVVGPSLTGIASVMLMLCLFGYYLPRQIALHINFTGMSAGNAIDMAALVNPPLRHALVVTSDGQLYGYTLFGLNDPLLRGNVIYAEAATAAEYAELHRAYPDRAMYVLTVDPSGAVRFTPAHVSAMP